MTTDDQARCEEIERLSDSVERDARQRAYIQEEIRELCRQVRFLLDLARTADAMLRTAFLDHGLDVEKVVAEAERRAAIECCRIVDREEVYCDRTAAELSAAIRSRFNLPPLEERGQ